MLLSFSGALSLKWQAKSKVFQSVSIGAAKQHPSLLEWRQSSFISRTYLASRLFVRCSASSLTTPFLWLCHLDSSPWSSGSSERWARGACNSASLVFSCNQRVIGINFAYGLTSIRLPAASTVTTKDVSARLPKRALRQDLSNLLAWKCVIACL